MKKNKRHKFSLIELICIILIVGLLITMGIIAVNRMLNESRINNKLAQEELINKACKLYIDNNSNVAPKVVGDTINVSFKTLKEKGYLLKDVYNSNNENCMNNSYVRVYKLNEKEYTYLPYLHCGDEKIPEVEELVTPTVRILFIDGKESTNNNLIFNNIHESRLYIEIDGGEDSFGRKIEIDTYEITIYVSTKTNPELKEYYSSGIINANKRYTYTIDKKMVNYVKVSDATSINVVVKATNTLGGVNEVTSIAQSNNRN